MITDTDTAATITAGLATLPDPARDRAGKPVPKRIATPSSPFLSATAVTSPRPSNVAPSGAASPPSRSSSARPPRRSCLLTSTAASCGPSRWSGYCCGAPRAAGIWRSWRGGCDRPALTQPHACTETDERTAPWPAPLPPIRADATGGRGGSCGTRQSKKFATADAHRCTSMGQSLAGSLTAETPQPKSRSPADAVGTVHRCASVVPDFLLASLPLAPRGKGARA